MVALKQLASIFASVVPSAQNTKADTLKTRLSPATYEVAPAASLTPPKVAQKPWVTHNPEIIAPTMPFKDILRLKGTTTAPPRVPNKDQHQAPALLSTKIPFTCYPYSQTYWVENNTKTSLPPLSPKFKATFILQHIFSCSPICGHCCTCRDHGAHEGDTRHGPSHELCRPQGHSNLDGVPCLWAETD